MKKINRAQMIFTESFKKPQLKKLKEAVKLKEDTINSKFADEVAKAIKTLESIPANVFYTALGIYEWTGETNPSEEVCNKVYDFLDDVDTVYDEYVRGEVQSICNGDSEETSVEDENSEDAPELVLDNDEDTDLGVEIVDDENNIQEESFKKTDECNITEDKHIKLKEPSCGFAKNSPTNRNLVDFTDVD